MALDIINCIVSPVAQYLIVPIGRQIGYVFSYTKNIDNLKNQVEKLTMQKVRIQHDVEHARRQGEEIEDDVQNWLSKVDAITEETRILLEDKEKCFMGLCANLITRHHLSRKATQKLQVVVDFQTEGKFNSVSYRAPPQGIGLKTLKDYEAFKSRKPILNEILEALEDARIDLIGVYGMPGVGKTTFVKDLAREVREKNMFEMVVLATVTQSPDMEKIQEEIAEKLDLKFDVRTVEVRAERLCEQLKKEKKILVILDDIWERIDLEKVGIPVASDHSGCKVLMTSRNRNVLSRQMDAKENFPLQVLPQDEAWNLFEKMIGDKVKDPDFQIVAAEIAKKCAGLPILLVTVARALRGGGLSEWKVALEQLKRFDNNDIDAQTYKLLELSYNFLKDDESKKLLLLCGQLSPYSISMSDLLKYTMGWGLFKPKNTLEAARHSLHKCVNDLKACCLLMEGDSVDEVRMHDVLRNFAISIAARDHNVLTVTEELKEWPVLEQCTGLYLPYCNFPEFPTVFECPKAELFILYNTDPSLQVGDCLFRGTKKLKVLDMSDVHLSRLPSSLQFLENLQTLCLDRCDLGDIAIIGELRMLQVLSLISSNLVRLPREIGQLTRLQLLDLKNNPTLEEIPPNVLSCLTQLEDLYMENSFVLWGDKLQSKHANNASLSELKHLQNLVTLDAHITDAKLLPKDLFFEKLERFRIFIGDGWDWSGEYETSRTLKFKLHISFSLGSGIQKLLERTEDLYLHDLKAMKSILYDLNAEGLRQLKRLHIQNSLDVQYIVDSIMMAPSIAFPHLQLLSLCSLHMLEKVCHGQPMAESFSNLRILKVAHCHKLKNLFSLSTARGLPRLEEIGITDCKILEGIVALEDDGVAEQDDVLNLNKLWRLTLEFLPQFQGTSTSQTNFEIVTTDARTSNKIVPEKVFGIPLPLFNKKIVFLNLQELKLGSINNVDKIWINPPTDWLLKLTSLTVEACGNLKYIFDVFMVEYLVQLQKLEVYDCKLLEEIIFTEQSSEGEILVIFPKLQLLKLKSLPKLKRFCTSNLIKFPSLKVFHIKDSPEMKTFTNSFVDVDMGANSCVATETNPTFFDEKVFVPNLQELEIIGMDHLSSIWRDEFIHSDSFCKLKTLKVINCKNLLRIFPHNKLMSIFQNIERLQIRDCYSLEEVFDLQLLRKGKGTQATIVMQLRKMDIRNLPNLKNVWNGNPHGTLSFQNLHSILIWHCLCLKSIFHASVASRLLQLEVLNIDNCGVEVIVSKEEELEATPPVFVFTNKMTFLRLWRLPELKRFYSGISHTSEWPALKKLYVSRCKNIRIFDLELPCSQGEIVPCRQDQLEQPLFSFEKIIPNMEELSLDSKGASMINERQFPPYIFDKIKILWLLLFNDESTNLLFDVIRRVRNLEKLILREGFFRQMFPSELAIDEEEISKIDLTQIRHLQLHYLPNLEHIWDQAFPANRLLPNLCTLEVCSCHKLVSLAPPAASFQNLTSLDVWLCKGLLYLITSSTARSLMQLTILRVRECGVMTEIVANEGDQDGDIHEIAFLKLQSLTLDRLISLTSFCTSSNLTFKFPSLSEVIVTQCPMMETFSGKVALSTPKLQRVWVTEKDDKWRWTNDLNNTIQQLYTESVSFLDLEDLILSPINMEKLWRNLHVDLSSYIPNLTNLTVKGCENLKYIFSSVMVRGLPQLTKLEVHDCKLMEEIIVKEQSGDGRIGSKLMFPKLECLILKGLLKLQRFCTSGLIEFPSLKKLYIKDNPEIKTFASSCFNADGEAASNEVSETKPSLFDEKVFVPNLEELQIDGLHHLRLIWHGELHLDSFSKLKTLKVNNGKHLLKIFAPNDPRRFQNVETLEINDCELLEEVFDLPYLRNGEGTNTATITQLTTMDIQNLPNLKNLWNGNPQDILSFQNLQSMLVWDCPCLKSVFPASIALDLEQLQVLDIVGCGVEEIVSKEKELGVAPKFVFPKMTSVTLWRLSKLKRFYPETHNTEWPALKKLSVYHCDEMRIFDFDLELQSSQVPCEGDQFQIKVEQPLFSFTKIIPNLEELALTSKEAAMIKQGGFSLHAFHKLKALDLQCFHDESVDFPFDIPQGIPNMEKLVVSCLFFKQLFPSDQLVSVEEHAKTDLAQIRHLELEYLPNLEHIWHQTFPVDQLLPNLETLEVKSCDNLINFAPPAASFQSLTSLTVVNCSRLVYLITSSTARGLVQLTTMSVRKCGSLKEIVAKEGDDAENEVIFIKLKSLTLDRLTSLATFCSSNLAFKFPSLLEVIVIQCPMLETFSGEILSTPRLQRVWLAEGKDEWRWRNDLNNTIQQLYTEAVSFLDLEDLTLSTINVKRLWWNLPVHLASCIPNLTNLMVNDCENLKYLFSSAMVRGLPQLEKLEVYNCKLIEEIIVKEQSGDGGIGSPIMFPKLELLMLKGLSKLQRFCTSDLIEFPLLEKLYIENSPEIKTFSSSCWGIDVEGSNEKTNLSLFDEKVFVPNLVELRIDGLDHLRLIWHDESIHPDSFCKLETLNVINGKNLLRIFPHNKLSIFQNLERLEVRDCNSLEEVFDLQLLRKGKDMHATAVMQLRTMDIRNLPKLKNVWNGNSERTLSFQNLHSLLVWRCPSLKCIFPASTASGLLQLEVLNIDSCGVEVIVSEEEELEASPEPMFLFPKMTSLILRRLSKLKKFCSGIFHTLEWSELKKLYVNDCENMPLFDLELPGCQGVLFPCGEDQLETEVKQPLLSFTKEDLARIRQVLPVDQFLPIFRSTLEEWSCHSLFNLAPSSASFQNLTSLNVWRCKRLIYFMTSSTIKSLVQLTTLSVRECGLMTEIVANEEENGENEISFLKLQTLTLNRLTSLASFCSSNVTLMFPSLSELVMTQCPVMEIFSKKTLSTPKLQRAWLTEERDKWRWSGDLNNTIRQLYIEPNA